MNGYEGGVFQQTLSGVTNLNNQWYDGKAYQKYAFEYTPGETGQVTWLVGDTKTWSVDAKAVRPNGNIGQRVIPKEPMALVANFGMSNGFAALNFTGLGKTMPATLRFDYIRIYQKQGQQSVTCDPPGMETTPYIQKFSAAYNNPNMTKWYAFLHQSANVDTDAILGPTLATNGRRMPS